MGKIEIVEPLSRIEVILLTWADWMRSGGSVARGYPGRTCGVAGAGRNQVEDMEDACDTWIAKAVDAIVRGLPEEERSAIHHQYLDARYRFQIVFYSSTLHRAKDMICAAAKRRGIW